MSLLSIFQYFITVVLITFLCALSFLSGDSGAKSVMRTAITVGGRTKVTADRCNIVIRDDKAWFNYDKPLQKFQLDMQYPYEYAVALQLLMVSISSPSRVFSLRLTLLTLSTLFMTSKLFSAACGNPSQLYF